MIRSTLLAVVLALFGALAGGDDTDEVEGAVAGIFLNATCAGSCDEAQTALPFYEAPNLLVVIRSLPERTRIARIHPKNGRFSSATGPGAYRVRVRVRESGNADCWEGSATRVEVSKGVISRVRLRVTNVCVL